VRKTIFLVGLSVFAVLASSCSQRTKPIQSAAEPDHRAADAAAVRAADAAWVKAATAKNASKFVSFYAADATLLPPGAPMTTGKEAIEEAWQNMMKQPGFALTFAPSKVVVSKAGDLAYDLGNYSLTMNDPHGKPQTSKGKYVAVWARQADGTWKVVIDAPTTTQ
jgi:uncharacterized protein (TIGR02246 family)